MAIRTVVALVLLAALIGENAEADDQTWKTRMNACVALLRSQDPQLRNAWRGHCGTTEVSELISGSAIPANRTEEFTTIFNEPRAAAPVSSGDCGSSPQRPASALSTCGLGSKTLYQNLSSAAVLNIRLPGNKCASFIPVLLTNKTDFACNAVQTRIACVDTSYDAGTDRTTIKLSTKRGGTPDGTTIVVGTEELRATKGHLDDLIRHPQFALLPSGGNNKDIIKIVTAAVTQSQNQCIQILHNSPQDCRSQAVTNADAYFQQQLRYYRNPKRFLSAANSKKDATAIVADIKAYYGASHIENWLLFLSLAANEVGLSVTTSGIANAYDPIYALSDAVAGNSGLSFGAHQIDLGANDSNDLQTFWTIISSYNAQNPSDILKQAADKQSCVDLPLRYMTVRALQLTYHAAPAMDTPLRTSEGATSYDTLLKSFLDKEVAKISALPGVFQHSMMTQILFADRENQYGSGQHVADLAAKLVKSTDDLQDCGVVTDEENKILDALIYLDPVDQNKGKTTYWRRYDNIRTIVRNRAPNAGRLKCS